MAIYACDFAITEDQGIDTCNNAIDMNDNINTYTRGVRENLSTWSGKARESFDKSSSTVVSKAQTEAEAMSSLGDFILLAKDAIYDLEEKLSGMNI